MHHHLRITPTLEPDDAAYLLAAVAEVRWPGRPAAPCPWRPCEEGCCLALVPGAGSAQLPGVAAQWLRFLVATYLRPRHRLDGTLELATAHGLQRSLLIVEDGEVFEGVVDRAG
ncbi:hypothetical protein DDE18_17570 [Nocardioides gansuensis]|uniref:Uncharacterized protein n=1 Tax=Nocardioides gansuensis TaxID=2138300 RepID=A0A2T8F7T6_9ACTN|nr:hypothetical protein [Nocardioides gansuensis]PVG81776.1 hypothetical protein DDE18_17570 [Nocardioides gansuensis]